MEDKLYIKQINLQHCKGATSLISNHIHALQTKKPHKQLFVYLIQEPWINRNVIHGFNENEIDLFYKKTNRQKPRTCIVASKELKAVLMPQHSSGDVTTILVNLSKANSNEEVIFSSFYMPYEEQHNIPDETARDAINFSASYGIPIIIGADCNAHHSLWNSSNTNTRGEKLVEYLATTCLDIQNYGNEPTYVNSRRQEIIDITLASQTISNRITRWHVSCEETLSDHREINFTLECTTQKDVLFRNPRFTDWNIFSKVLKSKINKLHNLQDINTPDKLDRAVERLTKSLNSAYICACPGRVKAPKRNRWWNNELQKLKLETRKLYRIARASKGSEQESECWLALRKSRNNYTKEIRRAQADAWSTFCSSIEGASATSRLHKLLAKAPTKGPGILIKPDGNYTENSSEVALLLLNTHFPGNIRMVDNEDTTFVAPTMSPTKKCRNVEETNTSHLDIDEIITHNRVNWAISSFDKYKAPGFDNIYPIMLQKTWKLIGEIIVNIYKKCLQLNYVPKKWTEVKVIFIPKPG